MIGEIRQNFTEASASVGLIGMRQLSNKFHYDALTMINFVVIFPGMKFKFWKSWPNFFKFQFLVHPILAIRGNRRQETASMPSPKQQNLTIMIDIQLMWKSFWFSER